MNRPLEIDGPLTGAPIPAPDEPPSLGRTYDRYYRSGLYAQRYPRPNPRTLGVLRRFLPKGGRLLDYGAGEGRYSLPLCRSQAAEVVAVDLSPVARTSLSQAAREQALGQRIAVLAPDSDELTQLLAISGRFDVVLLGFGVLGHVAGRAQRIGLLRRLRPALGRHGRLVLGLPNAGRRFAEEQRNCAPEVAAGSLEPGDIRYTRQSADGPLPLFYHLFRLKEVRRDLIEAGYVIDELSAESILPESAVTHSWALGRLDGLASGLLPAAWGYGFLVVARAACR